MSAAVTTLQADPAQFMQLAAQGASLSSHADLWQWLQGGVQKLLPHDVLLVCWGDFRSRNLRFDLVSSLPGLRTSECQASMVAPLASYLRDCWVAAQNLPCQVDVAGCADLLGDSGTGWPAGHPIAGMQSALVHGMQEAGDGTERIFAMLSRRPRYDAAAASMLRLLVPFVDLSLRCMPPVPARPVHGERASLSGEKLTLPVASLSERERQIMAWVAMGKTNPEIGCILRISEFTVKNHMKSIFSKLDVTNRAQAVAKLTRMATHA